MSNKKLTPTFFWVSKCDVMLGSLDFNFKTRMGKCAFKKIELKENTLRQPDFLTMFIQLEQSFEIFRNFSVEGLLMEN